MAKKNFLLGKGERLAEPVIVKGGPVNKLAPYTFLEAKERLQPMLNKVVNEIDELPEVACPDDYAVAMITLNPEYIAKSYYPADFLRTVGLDAVGSRARKILPEKRSKDREPEETTTTELYLLGKRGAFKKWADEFGSWTEQTPGASQIVEIEAISFPKAYSKIKKSVEENDSSVFEVVLHLDERLSSKRYLDLFEKYLNKIGGNSRIEKRFFAGGLCFLEVEATNTDIENIARFSLVRVLRKMPSLRLLRPAVRSIWDDKSKITLPDIGPIDPNINVAIFDGGVPASHPICKWVRPIEIEGMVAADSELLEHGVGVTSAFLFGHINPKEPIQQPYSYVDHYRVLDNMPGQNPYELYEVLERISNVIENKKYDFINLSLGPCLPIDDEEVHAWTAVLDEFLSKGTTLATIAVGNDGEGDPSIQANRIQVPADCVNALSIGACDIPDNGWQRAIYSCVGPGRSPGLVKPDLVEFGGSIERPFLTLDSSNSLKLKATGGTSFSAPSALRLGTGVRAHFGNSLNALAIRTLLVHCAENADIAKSEIGWGRISRNLEEIAICEDHVIRVVYQGSINASKYIRVPVPLPLDSLKGKVKVKATLCYTCPVDPHHPSNYTRSGIEITFRPNKDTKRKVKDHEPEPLHAKPRSFFGKTQKSFQTEEELRRDAWKWENCLHAEDKFLSKTLNEPVFDIHYNARIEGRNDTSVQEMQYVLVISVEAPKVKDLYDQVVRRYSTQLEQLQPIIDIPLKLGS